MDLPKPFQDSLAGCFDVLNMVEELQENLRSIESSEAMPAEAKEKLSAIMKEFRPDLENPVSEMEAEEKQKTFELVNRLDVCCKQAKPLVEAVGTDLRKLHPVEGVTCEDYHGGSYGELTLKLGGQWIGWHFGSFMRSRRSQPSPIDRENWKPPSRIDCEYWKMLVRNEHEKAAALVAQPTGGKPKGKRKAGAKPGPKPPTGDEIIEMQDIQRDWLAYTHYCRENRLRLVEGKDWQEWRAKHGNSDPSLSLEYVTKVRKRFKEYVREHPEYMV